MPIIRKVFGPFSPEVTNRGTKIEDVRWYFFGIRGDGEMSHWVLVFDPRKRSFLASNTGKHEFTGRHRKTLLEANLNASAGPSIHPRMFIEGDTTLTVEGKITDILKSKLPAAEIAKATALAITKR